VRRGRLGNAATKVTSTTDICGPSAVRDGRPRPSVAFPALVCLPMALFSWSRSICSRRTALTKSSTIVSGGRPGKRSTRRCSCHLASGWESLQELGVEDGPLLSIEEFELPQGVRC
jgi:hypothetical protein